MSDLLDLLNEISSEKPCGEHLEYDAAYLELVKNILGKPEDTITGEKAQPPNWRDIQKDTIALLRRSKDLQLVLYLLRALIHLEGVSGFRDGLNLLIGLLEKYWDTIHPVLDPDDNYDPTSRVNIIEELSSFEAVLRPLSLAPLVDSKVAGRFSLRDIHIATDKINLPEGATKTEVSIIKGAFQDLPAESLKATYQAIMDCASLVKQLDTFINDKVGIGNGPDLSPQAALLRDMQNAFEQFVDVALLDEEVQADGGEPGEDSSTPTSTASSKQAGVGGIHSRQDVLKALDLICKYYAETEPSSPVPILLHRAKSLVTLDFMQILQNLLPDAVQQMGTIRGPDSNTN